MPSSIWSFLSSFHRLGFPAILVALALNPVARLHAQSVYPEVYAIGTLADSGASGSTDGSGVAASFDFPSGTAVDGGGNIYVADSSSNKVRKISAAGVVTTLAGSGDFGFADGSGAAASFNGPSGVAVDSVGNVYVADSGNRRIRKISAAGVVTTLAGSGAQGSTDGSGATASFNSPRGVTVDGGGNLYVADSGNRKIRKISAAGVVTTLAGSGASGSVDGSGAAASFNNPNGVALDSGGNVYVADSSNHKIRKISAAGVVTTLAGSGGQSSTDGTGAAAGFNFPTEVAVDSGGSVYVADYSNHKIRRISATGVVTTLAGSGSQGSVDGSGATASFNGPRGVAVDGGGNVYVGDSRKIRRISPAGVVTTLAGSGAYGSTDGSGVAANFNYPSGVAVDGGGNVYVADYSNNKIRRISAAGVVTTLAGSGGQGSTDGNGAAASFNRPRGVAVDGGGNVYVADYYNYKIRRISAAGAVTTLAGSGSQGSVDGSGAAASFHGPNGVAVDGGGNVYVADAGNKIRRISPAGVVTTLAGSGGYGSLDGSGAAASFSNPNGVVVDGGGNVYVADYGNNKIRRISPAGVVTTLAGSGASGYTDGSGAAASFNRPSGVAVDGGGNVYVADNFNHRIRKISAEGVVTTLAGSAGQMLRDGTGADARFNSPNGVAVDDGGNIYVADTNNHVIRKGIPLQQQTIVFPGLPGKTFGDPPFTLNGAASSGLPVSFSIVSGPADISGNIISLNGVGTVTVRASQSGGLNLNYAAAPPVDRSFTVVKASQTVIFDALEDRNYRPAPFTISATASSGLSLTFSVVSGPATVSGNQMTLTGTGTVVIRASQPGNANYLAAPTVERSFIVSKAPQTITVAGPSERTLAMTNQSISINATASSGLPVSLTRVSGPGTVSGTSLTLSGIGTVVVRASQAGNAFYSSAPDVTITFTVTANTLPPTSIALSKTHFYDNVASGPEIAVLSSVDPDVGDTFSYALVIGEGATDNAKFTITGDSLKAAATFNYDNDREVSIRVRSTDSAGQSYEQVLVLKILPAAPNAKFVAAGPAFTLPPDPALGDKSLPYVNAIFQLLGKGSERGLNYPRSLFDPASPDYQPDLFQAFEGTTVSGGTSPIAFNESYFQVGKISDVPSKVRTVLLLDCSNSISLVDLALIKTAAKGMVDKMFEEQEIAIYSFSGTTTKIQDFTGKSDANQMSLKAAIDTIVRGSATTNLYGSMLEMLNLPAWKESFTKDGIETGFLVVLTDGADSSGSATKEQVKDKRGDVANSDREVRRVYTIGLGTAIEPGILTDLENMDFYRYVDQAGDLAAAFDEIQKDIIDLANSFYQFNYISPKRGSNPPNTPRRLEVKLKNNTNSTSDGTLKAEFNSQNFTDLAPAMYINRTVHKVTGIDSPSPLEIKNPNLAETASAITLFPPLDFSSFTWSIGNPALATLTPQGAIGERVIITPNGQNGTTTLTLTDTISNFTKTIPLVIGTGASLPPQSIAFAPLPDRAPSSPSFTLAASASSLLPVSFSLVSGPATVSGNTARLTGSTGIVTIRATQAGNASYAPASLDRSFTVAATSALLANWASSAGLTGPDAGAAATPYSDGVANLLKFAFNMNAAGPDVRVLPPGGGSGLPHVEIDDEGTQAVLKVTYLRRKGSGLVYTPQWSDNLGAFSPMSGTPAVTSIDSQWERVTVEEPNPPAAGGAKGFARVKVSGP